MAISSTALQQQIFLTGQYPFQSLEEIQFTQFYSFSMVLSQIFFVCSFFGPDNFKIQSKTKQHEIISWYLVLNESLVSTYEKKKKKNSEENYSVVAS